AELRRGRGHVRRLVLVPPPGERGGGKAEPKLRPGWGALPPCPPPPTPPRHSLRSRGEGRTPSGKGTTEPGRGTTARGEGRTQCGKGTMERVEGRTPHLALPPRRWLHVSKPARDARPPRRRRGDPRNCPAAASSRCP